MAGEEDRALEVEGQIAELAAADPTKLLDVASDLAAPTQAADMIYGQAIVNGNPVASIPTDRPQRGVLNASDPAPDKSDAVAPRTRSKVAAELTQRVSALKGGGCGNDLVDVLVLFQEKLAVPRFPAAREDQARDSAENLRVLSRAQNIVDRVKAARANDHAAIGKELASIGAKVRESFWLINAMSLHIPANSIEALAARPDVVSVDPVLSGTAGVNQLSDSRAIINSDPYFNLNLTSGWIGAIDSGVRSAHTHFNNPARLTWVRDCVNGTSNNCGTGSNLNPADQANHGSSVISILVGNGNLGANNRGVSGVRVDSFRVTDAAGGIYGDAFIRAYSAAVGGGDKVITASLQRWEDENSTIAAAAESAYTSGSVILACQGNQGPSTSQVRCPGNARKVLAIGAVDVTSQMIENYSSRGPSNDGRYKPDLVAPVNVTTSSNASDTATRMFGGCSAATPHAAASAMMFRNWVLPTIPNVDPGQIYAFMINMGNKGTYAFDNTHGAGIFSMPTNATWWGSKTTVTTSSVVDMPINVSGTVSRIDVAIWWPETSARHNDVDVALINPSGTQVASSTSVPSVYEKIRFNTTTTGTWKVRIRSYNVSGNQDVYWAAFQRY